MSAPASAPTAEPLSRVRSESVHWLWQPYFPRGKLVLLDGDPGVGKSLITIDLAARLSRAGPLPDGQAVARPHTTLLLSAEDSAADTLRPRAEAAGADLDRVVVVTGSDGAPMRFPADIPTLEAFIRTHSVDLVVIDPVMAFLPPEVATSNDQCVRGVLGALARLAARTDCTVLLVRHLRKKGAAKAVHRGLGSVGIIGAVRVGLLAAPHPTDPNLRVLAVTKTNLERSPPALGFRLRGDGAAGVVVEWPGPVEQSADALGQSVLGPRDRAGDWLHAMLSAGPRKATDVLAAAVAANIPERTLNRAKTEIGMKSRRVHMRGELRVWYWYDPSVPWPKDAPFPKPDPHELPPIEFD